MNRTIHRCCLAFVCLVACAAPAAAGDWWDAMEAWSGPGPFKHRFGNFFGTICEDTIKARAEGNKGGFPPLRIANEFESKESLAGRPKPCVYLNFAGYRVEADSDKGYGAVDLQTYDFGLLFEVRRGIDVGFGAGWIASESNGVNKTWFALTPIKIAIRPVCLFRDCADVNHRAANHWARVWTFTAHERWIPSKISSADFGAPNVKYAVDDEFLTSGGLVTLDIGEMIAAIKTMNRP